jgi:hypothetical protein
MTKAELEAFSNTHLFKLASEKFHKMAELDEGGAPAAEISPYLVDVEYIMVLLEKRGFI